MDIMAGMGTTSQDAVPSVGFWFAEHSGEQSQDVSSTGALGNSQGCNFAFRKGLFTSEGDNVDAGTMVMWA